MHGTHRSVAKLSSPNRLAEQRPPTHRTNTCRFHRRRHHFRDCGLSAKAADFWDLSCSCSCDCCCFCTPLWVIATEYHILSLRREVLPAEPQSAACRTVPSSWPNENSCDHGSRPDPIEHHKLSSFEQYVFQTVIWTFSDITLEFFLRHLSGFLQRSLAKAISDKRL